VASIQQRRDNSVVAPTASSVPHPLPALPLPGELFAADRLQPSPTPQRKASSPFDQTSGREDCAAFASLPGRTAQGTRSLCRQGSKDGTFMLRPTLQVPAYHDPRSILLCLIGILFHYEENTLIWTYNKSAREPGLGSRTINEAVHSNGYNVRI
jgi:hypothetical protein